MNSINIAINEEKDQIINMQDNQDKIEKNKVSNKKVKNYNIEVEEHTINKTK